MATKKQEDSLSLAQLRASQKRATESAERLRELEIFNKMRRGEQLTPEERRAYQLKQRSQVPKPLPEQGTVGAVPPTQERLKELEVFNKMRRGEKLTPEEQRANQLRERSQVPLPRPEFRSPIDMVRDPNYDIAMAQQNYANFMADQSARMEADRANSRIAPIPPPEQGQFTQGRLMGAPTNQMLDYNNFLQQGIQSNNTLNQGAMTNPANIKPRAQVTQPAMPVAGMQQPNSAPRKFSTPKNLPARFG